jgi:hypothetical protein
MPKRVLSLAMLATLAALAGVTATRSAAAAGDDASGSQPSGATRDAPGPAMLSLRVGGLIPTTKLSTTFVVEGGFAYHFLLNHSLGAFIDASYAQPTASGTTSDPRLAAGTSDWKLTVRDIGITIGAQYLRELLPAVLVYGGIGAKTYFTQSKIVSDSNGTPLGEHTGNSRRLGIAAKAGGGYRVGPGAVILELHYEYTPIDQLITGDANTANLSLQLGFALFLGGRAS